jgi:translocation and assembly module TamB
VSASPDVVIVKNGKEVAAKRGLDIFAKIRVILGDDVHVAAAGFKGQLKGNLLVEQTPQLAPRGTGIVEVVAGDYKVYGQDLRIERGRVLFSGGPIDNPGLDLRAVRKVDEVTAGAQVGGTLKTPRLQLFSTPSMSDSQIISYLVFGRPPSGSGAETAMLQNAAAALAMSEGNKLTKGISDAVGVDEFKLASGASPKDAAFVIGKYLSPDLYVSYGVGLFEAVNTFKLRYRLSKRLYFESSSTSTSSGADLTYTTER